jgi:hypothetical protein
MITTSFDVARDLFLPGILCSYHFLETKSVVDQLHILIECLQIKCSFAPSRRSGYTSSHVSNGQGNSNNTYIPGRQSNMYLSKTSITHSYLPDSRLPYSTVRLSLYHKNR